MANLVLSIHIRQRLLLQKSTDARYEQCIECAACVSQDNGHWLCLASAGICYMCLYIYIHTYIGVYNTHVKTMTKAVCGKVAQAGSPACLAAARVRLTPARGG